MTVGVVEKPSGGLAAALSSCLSRRPGEGVIIERADNLRHLSGGPYSLIAVTAPMAPVKKEGRLPRCSVLLVPGTFAAQAVKAVEAERVITYGMSRKDTITVSSLGSRECMVFLQRELTTLSGGILEPQEIPVHLGRGLALSDILPLTGAAALLSRGGNIV